MTKRRAYRELTSSGWRRAFLLLQCLCGCVAVTLAASSLRGRGSCAGTIQLTPLGGTKADIQINTVGVITHLGKSTVSVHSTADFSGAVPVAVPPSIGTVTAANGNTIGFSLKWTAQTVSAGVFDVIGPFEVTGGDWAVQRREWGRDVSRAHRHQQRPGESGD